MLAHIDPDCDYEVWYRCGMAIHHSTGGNGFDIWDDWSRKGQKYPDASTMEKRWHSFGKSGNPVTLGTLMHYAEQNGYSQSVEFECTEEFQYEEESTDGLPFSINGVDVKRPPGFVGELTSWINDQCRHPRENLAVAAALTAIGNIVGLRNTDDMDSVTTNLFAFCVAGSSSGKEAVLEAIGDIHRAAGIQAATHGAIKSEQEITRNLIRHQSAFYVFDEMGELLQKLIGSKKNGGASYLQGVIGLLMSAYSKANGYLLLTGDLKEEITKMLRQEHASVTKMIENNEGGKDRLDQIEKSLNQIDKGLEKPFLSMIGFTTPITFDSLVTYEQATNGFIGRSLLINERETNPRAKRRFRKRKMDIGMEMFIKQLYTDGECDLTSSRIEYYGNRHEVQTTNGAAVMLDKCLDWIEEHAEYHKENTGLEAIVRRGYELIAKISLILAVPSGVRSEEHVRWAFALIHRDIEEKTRLAFANDREKSDPINAMSARFISIVDKDNGATLKQFKNRFRTSESNVTKVVDRLVDNGFLEKRESKHPVNNKKIIKYYGVK